MTALNIDPRNERVFSEIVLGVFHKPIRDNVSC